MANIIIPFEDLASFTFSFAFDDTIKLVNLTWDSRDEFWTISLYETDETPILIGKKLTVNFEILDDYHACPEIPQGRLFILHNKLYHQRIERDDFLNEVCDLVYQEVV